MSFRCTFYEVAYYDHRYAFCNGSPWHKNCAYLNMACEFNELNWSFYMKTNALDQIKLEEREIAPSVFFTENESIIKVISLLKSLVEALDYSYIQ